MNTISIIFFVYNSNNHVTEGVTYNIFKLAQRCYTYKEEKRNEGTGLSSFSKKMDEYILHSGLSYAEAAKRAGIERTQLLKMKKGDRTGDEQALKRLCSALMLSSSQEEELHRYYLIAKMGDDVYTRRKLVKTLIEQMRHLSDASPLRMAEGLKQRIALPDSAAISGRDAVSDLLRAVIEREIARDRASIYLIAQPEETLLMEFLAEAGRVNQNLHLEHIVCFQQGIENSSENHYNLETFHQILPLFISGCKYEPLYFYDDVAARFSDTAILPYLLITSECCVAFSKGMGNALLSRQPDSCKLYTKLFIEQKKTGSPLITLIPDAQSHLQFYLQYQTLPSEISKQFYSFFSVPCLAIFFDEDMLYQYINKDIPQVDEILSEYVHMMKNIYTVMREMNLTSYFSKKGLDSFLKTGRILEIPDEYYHHFSKETCEWLLHAMLKYAENGFYLPVMVDPEKFVIPDNLIISAISETVVKIVYIRSEYESLAFTIEEPSLTYAIYDFMQYLKTSSLVYTPEQTIEIVKKRLTEETRP